MNRHALTLWTAGSICVAMFAFAFVAAPKSCEGGLTAYFWSGVAAIVALIALPVVLRNDRAVPGRVLIGLGFGVLGAAVWIAGLFAANVRIMCRLF